MRTGKRLHPYGRRRLSGSAALTTEGDGWARNGLAREPTTLGPFDGPLSGPTHPLKAAKRAVEQVKRSVR